MGSTASPQRQIDVLILEPVNVTLLGNWALADVIQLKQGWALIGIPDDLRRKGRQRGKELWSNRGRGWDDASSSQRMLRMADKSQKKRDPPL